MYDFVWRDFCDWYLEAIKPTVCDRIDQQRRLHAVLDSILRLLHPICPFVTETLWPHVRSLDGIRRTPRHPAWTGPASTGRPLRGGGLACSGGRGRRRGGRGSSSIEPATSSPPSGTCVASRQVSPKRRIVLHAGEAVLDLVGRADGAVETLAGLESVVPDRDAPADAIPLPFEGGQVLLSNLVDAVDRDAERKRLEKTIEGKRSRSRDSRPSSATRDTSTTRRPISSRRPVGCWNRRKRTLWRRSRARVSEARLSDARPLDDGPDEGPMTGLSSPDSGIGFRGVGPATM